MEQQPWSYIPYESMIIDKIDVNREVEAIHFINVEHIIPKRYLGLYLWSFILISSCLKSLPSH